jgi:hypothetical protein
MPGLGTLAVGDRPHTSREEERYFNTYFFLSIYLFLSPSLPVPVLGVGLHPYIFVSIGCGVERRSKVKQPYVILVSP